MSHKNYRVGSTHSPNCQCNYCTSEDPYIAHVRDQFGKNAAHFDSAYSGGRQYFGFNEYDSHFNELGIAPVQTTTLSPVATQPIVQQQANLKQILGDALGTAVGGLIQAKKDGQILPKALDTVATLGIKTEQAALNAAQSKAEAETGKQVLKFSPIIIGVLIGVVLLLVVLFTRKK